MKISEKDYKRFIDYLPYKLYFMNQDKFEYIQEAKDFIINNNINNKIKETIPKQFLSGIVKFGIGYIKIENNKLIINNYKIDL